MPTQVGLYYPFIHFRDDAWIKLSALYWDRMGRIVPEDYELRDSDTVKELSHEIDFIYDFSPAAHETLEVGREFRTFLERHKKALCQRYDLELIGEWSPNRVTLERSRRGGDPRLAYVYAEKISDDLAGGLVETGLATRDRVGDPDWLGMHPVLANVYMSALADCMASRRHLSPVADETSTHLAVSGWTMERLAAVLLPEPTLPAAGMAPNEVEACMANIVLEAVIPDNLEQVPVKKIVQIRKGFGEQRLVFQETLRGIAQEEFWLQDVKDPVAFRMHLEVLYENRIEPLLAAYEKNLNLLGLPTKRAIISVLNTLPDIALQVPPAFLYTVNPLAGAFAHAASFTLIPILKPKASGGDVPKDASREDDPHSAGYLFHVREALEPATVSERLVERIKQVTTGVWSRFGQADRA